MQSLHRGAQYMDWHVAEGRADIFLTYCTNALVAQKENPGQQIVNLPDNLAVSLNRDSRGAKRRS